MSQEPKSSLVLGKTSSKKEKVSFGKKTEVEYKQLAQPGDYAGQLSDQEKQAQFNRQHQQYIQMKMNRKKQLLRIKREQFGTSSSEEEDSSEEDIEDQPVRKIESKKSKGYLEGEQDNKIYSVVAEIKKNMLETQLKIVSGKFLIDGRQYEVNQLGKVALFNNQQKSILLKMNKNEDDVMLIAQAGRETTLQIIQNISKEKLISKAIKLEEGSSKQNFKEEEAMEQTLIFGRILKKSQYLGSWEERFVAIRKDGLYSYKAPKGKHTMYISCKDMKELQTQFELIKGLLIVRVIYASTKTQFGLPMDKSMTWLSHFVRMIAFCQ